MQARKFIVNLQEFSTSKQAQAVNKHKGLFIAVSMTLFANKYPGND